MPSPTPLASPRLPSERRVVFLVGAVQFINILDFTMVMPLGPDFARALAIPLSQMGLVTSAYTLAAALSGLLGSLVLDRFDRRSALAVAMLGLGLGTAAGGLAHDLPTLILARLWAGACGGPATSVAFSIIADVVPAERRGRAMGAVAGALSVAQVVGIPAGLRLARLAGWRLPFFVVAAMGALLTLAAITLLPPMRRHLDGGGAGEPDHPPAAATLWALLRRPTVLLSYAMTALVMGGGFLLLPNVPAWVLRNLHFSRDRLELLYAVGGGSTFLTNRLFGRLVDRLGSTRVALGSALALLPLTWLYFILAPPWMPVLPVFVLFAVVLGARNVAYNSLTSRVPRPHERARFLSLQSAVYHLASSIGAATAAHLLREQPDHSLGGMPRVALSAIALTALFPLAAWAVERRLRGQAR